MKHNQQKPIVKIKAIGFCYICDFLCIVICRNCKGDFSMELCKEFKSICSNVNKKRLNENFELDFQVNLPQYLDDIEKIIKCSVKNVVTNYECSDTKITIHGKTLINITYLNCDMCSFSNIFEEEFSKSFDFDDDITVAFAQIQLNTKYSNFRLINQRRIDIHTALNARICLYARETGKCLSNCKNAFVKECSLQRLDNKNCGISSCEFDEIFSVANNNAQIKNIVNSFGVCIIDDKKIIKDKMLIKMKVEISILYSDDDNNIEKCMHSFSVSKIIDIDDSLEDDKVFVTADISGLYVKTKANTDNILNDIEIVGNIAINYQVYSISEESLITDSYIPYFLTKADTEKSVFKNMPVYYYDDRTDEINFECDKNIIEIIDLKTEIENTVVEESQMTLFVKLSFLYYDDASQICFFEKTEKVTFTLCDEKFDGEGVANILFSDYVIKGTNKLTLRISYVYNAYLYKTETIDYLTDIEVSAQRDNLNTPQLTLYFADADESVWDIAKKFSTDMSLIIEENNLSSQIIEKKMVLLVPGM